MEAGILNHIRVLDFTRVLAGPYATRILGDFGAEVIKVQSRKSSTGAEDNRSAYFRTWNRNKRSITLDMDHEEAVILVRKLVSQSDVVVENYSPRVMTNWGLDYERLRKIKKDIIMVRMSGMGRTGPWKDYVAFGPTVQSLCGLTFLTSDNKGEPAGPGYSYADIAAGLYGALAVLAALEYRESTGLGQCIDLSEYEAACTLLGPFILDLAVNQEEILPMGNRSPHRTAAPHGCYPCLGEDRWCVIAVFEEQEWEALCHIMGDPSWAREDRFSTPSGRKKHEAELDERMREWTKTREAEEIVQRLQEVKVPSAVVQNAADLARDPQLSARRYFRVMEDPVSGPIRADTCPIRWRSEGKGVWRPAPLLGEDNSYVFYKLLGLPEDMIRSYREKGIIG